MKNLIYTTTAFAVFALLIAGCKKKSDAPVINITSPANNASVPLSDSVHVEGKITDDKSLHEAAFLIMSPSGDTVLKDFPYVHDKKTHTFHYHYKPAATGIYLLQVIAEDHDANTTLAARNFSITP